MITRVSVAAALAVLLATAALLLLLAPGERNDDDRRPAPESSEAPLSITFDGDDRLLTDSRGAGDHADLELTSGRLFTKEGDGWTNSPVFRARTRRADFGDVAVRMRLRNNGLSTSARTEAQPFDGVSIGLRYASQDELYYVNVARRDDKVTIKRKEPGGNGGRYTTLAAAEHPPAYETWRDVEVSARTVADAVVITLEMDGDQVLEARDPRTADALLRPGRVLVRGDNCEFAFDDLEVVPLR